MADVVIQGTVTAPIATGGPTAPLYIGSPKVSPVATTDTLTYLESKSATLKLTSAAGAVTVSMDTVASGNLVYIGCDYQTEITLNGNAYMIGDGSGTSSDGGFVMLRGAAVTALIVEAQLSVSTTITVAVYGD